MSIAADAGTPHRAMSDQVMENIRGGSVAQKLIFDVRGGNASPDALLDAFTAATMTPARRRGFCRELQKVLERTA